MTPTKEQAIQALNQVQQMLSNPDISGFTFDNPIHIRNALGVAAKYIQEYGTVHTGQPDPVIVENENVDHG